MNTSELKKGTGRLKDSKGILMQTQIYKCKSFMLYVICYDYHVVWTRIKTHLKLQLH